MDALVPMASQPSEMSSRNWMMRRLLIETIRSDPDYNNGNYTTQPRSMKLANVFFAIGTNGGTLAFQKLAPTRAAADKLVDAAPGRAVAGRRQRLPLSVGSLRATTIRRPAWSGSRPRCSPSMPPTMNAIRRKPESWSASSSA